MLALIHGVKEQSFPAARDSLPGVGTSTMLLALFFLMHLSLLHCIALDSVSNKLTTLFFCIVLHILHYQIRLDFTPSLFSLSVYITNFLEGFAV